MRPAQIVNLALQIKDDIVEASDKWNAHVDKQLERYCKKGCFGCCKQLVLTTLVEGATIAIRLVREKRLEDFEALAAQAKEVEELLKSCNGDAEAAARIWFKRDKPCLLLRGSECSIYDIRPTTCASYVTAKSPTAKNTGDKEPPETCEPAYEGGVPIVTNEELITMAIMGDCHFLTEIGLGEDAMIMPMPLPSAVFGASILINHGVEEFKKRLRVAPNKKE